ncbi:MAG: hypothetical protein NVSMB19_14390 [Vulcanimicrobiaceae bacterium]
MGRQIVNTGGQGLASSDAVKAAMGMLVVAAVVLLAFFFLNSATKNRAGDAPAATSISAPAPAAT